MTSWNTLPVPASTRRPSHRPTGWPRTARVHGVARKSTKTLERNLPCSCRRRPSLRERRSRSSLTSRPTSPWRTGSRERYGYPRRATRQATSGTICDPRGVPREPAGETRLELRADGRLGRGARSGAGISTCSAGARMPSPPTTDKDVTCTPTASRPRLLPARRTLCEVAALRLSPRRLRPWQSCKRPEALISI
jgi:hypothetical protein